jgi:hypothetical protein
MHLRNRLLLFGCYIALVSCSLENRIVGKYVSRGSSPTSNELLFIKEDKTFNVSSWSDVGGEFTSKGTWALNKDSLLLKREEQPKFKDIFKNYEYSYDPNINGVLIKTLWKYDSTRNPFIKVFLNGSSMPLDSLKEGVFFSKTESIHSVKIRDAVIDYEIPADYEIPKPKSKVNKLIIYWGDLPGEPSVDIGSQWKFKFNRLHSLEREGYLFKKVRGK